LRPLTLQQHTLRCCSFFIGRAVGVRESQDDALIGAGAPTPPASQSRRLQRAGTDQVPPFLPSHAE
jgi:hypothetical protein